MSSLTLDHRLPMTSSRPRVRTRPTRRRMFAPVGVLVVLALLVVFVAVGASRMIEVTGHHVGHGPAVAARHLPSGYGASLWPLGFTVHWSDGTDETHLWW